MPRKFMFTREQIIAAAVELTRKDGLTALTARALGARLGSSFGLFENMEEVRQEVMKEANEFYQSYIRRENWRNERSL